MKIVFNQDGSIRSKELERYINQHSTGIYIEIEVYEKTTDEYSCESHFTLPNGQTISGEVVNIDGHYQALINHAVTYFDGVVEMSISVNLSDEHIEWTYPVQLVINKTAEIWSPAGGDYVEGYGINISSDNVISVDSNEVQSKLRSGIDIKTLNGSSLLGSGDIPLTTTTINGISGAFTLGTNLSLSGMTINATGGGGGGGDAEWGSIGGTLSNQTDLNNALAGKMESTNTTFSTLKVVGSDASKYTETNFNNILFYNGSTNTTTLQQANDSYGNFVIKLPSKNGTLATNDEISSKLDKNTSYSGLGVYGVNNGTQQMVNVSNDFTNPNDLVKASAISSALSSKVDSSTLANYFTKTEIQTYYYTKAYLDSAIGAKQDSLNESQLAAVNSGITSAKVADYDDYANTKLNKPTNNPVIDYVIALDQYYKPTYRRVIDISATSYIVVDDPESIVEGSASIPTSNAVARFSKLGRIDDTVIPYNQQYRLNISVGSGAGVTYINPKIRHYGSGYYSYIDFGLINIQHDNAGDTIYGATIHDPVLNKNVRIVVSFSTDTYSYVNLQFYDADAGTPITLGSSDSVIIKPIK